MRLLMLLEACMAVLWSTARSSWRRPSGCRWRTRSRSCSVTWLTHCRPLLLAGIYLFTYLPQALMYVLVTRNASGILSIVLFLLSLSPLLLLLWLLLLLCIMIYHVIVVLLPIDCSETCHFHFDIRSRGFSPVWSHTKSFTVRKRGTTPTRSLKSLKCVFVPHYPPLHVVSTLILLRFLIMSPDIL